MWRYVGILKNNQSEIRPKNKKNDQYFVDTMKTKSEQAEQINHGHNLLTHSLQEGSGNVGFKILSCIKHKFGL